MTSSIHEAATSQRSRNFNLLIFILVTSIVLALSGDRVKAASQDVGPISRDVIDDINFNGNIYISQTSWLLADNANEIVVPVYYRFTNFSNTFNFTYLSGYFCSTLNLNIFGVDPNSPTNVTAAYFEGINDPTLHVSWTTSYSLRIYLDNFRILDNASWDCNLLLGYMHYSFNPPSTPYTFTFPTALKQVSANAATEIVGTAYEYGFAEAMAYAISTCDDIDIIIDWLSDIDQNTGYLYSIFTLLQSYYPSVTNYLDDISHSNYDLYVLIHDYLYPQTNPGADAASEAAAQVGSQAAQEHAAQESLYALSPGNMTDLDGALNDFGLLDDVKNSTDFWGYCINQFSSRSGPLWGIFIFGLILGLIAFILRLSR